MRPISWFATALLTVAGTVTASNDVTNSPEVCRSDDPFVYCTQGCKETKAWKPAKAPGAGYASIAYKPEPGYCPLPMIGTCCFGNVCFEPWSQEDFNDYYQNRVRVCPSAHEDGEWESGDGQGEPEGEPFSH